MLISYNTLILREICFHSATAIQYLGEDTAVSLQARHSDIQAASNIHELLVGNLSINGNHCRWLVSDNLSIVMVPNYAASDDGNLYDWSTVGRVKLMGINDVE